MCFVRQGSDGSLGEEGQSRENSALTTNMKIAERSERHRPPLPECTPWLVFPHGKAFRDQTFCSIVSSSPNPKIKYILKSIPEFCRKSFVASCHGWIVLSGNNDDNHYYLWNPVTLETIKLPPLKLEFAIVIRTCVLSSPPGSNSNCTLLLFHKHRPLISFCRPGDQQWSLHDYKKQLRIILGSKHFESRKFMDVVAFSGKLYALTFGEANMVIIDVDKPNRLTMRCLPTDIHSIHGHTNSVRFNPYLMESSGELLYIEKRYWGTSTEEVSAIIVHRMDFSEMAWVEVKSLKDRIIFLGDNCSVSCPATSGSYGSRIYFTMERDRSLYSFNLEDDSISVFSPCSQLPTPWRSPFWLNPDIRLMTHIGAEGEQKIKNEECNIKNDDKEYDSNVQELEDERQTEETWHLDDINLDILSLVADDLNLYDYLNFRSTCRLFRTAAPPLNRKTVLPKLKTQTLFPWFMFLKNNSNGVGKFTLPMNGDTFMMSIPELLLGSSSICCSKDGWVLMTKDMKTMFFFNPFTKEIGKFYPPWPNHVLPPVLGIGFSSELVTSTDCMMIVVCAHRSRVSTCDFRVSYIRFGEQEWDGLIFECDDSPEFEFIPNTNLVFWHGAFYMIDRQGSLGAIRITREDCDFEVLDKPQLPCKSFDSCFLLVCDGVLLLVFVGHVGKWVRIYSLDRDTLLLFEVEDLPNHMLFLSRSSSSYVRAPGTGNRIYFPRFRDQSIIYYSLETRKYHSDGHEDPLEDFYGTTEHLNCAWFEPKLL